MPSRRWRGGVALRGREGGSPVPYMFLLPALLLTVVVVFAPAAQTVWMSLHDYTLYRPFDVPFVGLANYTRMLHEPVFWISLINSAIWIVLVVGLQFMLGLFAALLLNQSFFWRGLARSIVIIPWALPSVIIGLIWTWMFDFNIGLLNDILLRLGIVSSPIPWLTSPSTALYSVILALIWQGFPFFAITILAGLQTVSPELCDACEIDGATRLARFRYVVWPAISEVVATALLLRTIWVANSLDVILVMTGGGPGYSTYTLPLYSFLRAYSGMEFGFGSSIALVLAAGLLALISFYVWRVSREAAE